MEWMGQWYVWHGSGSVNYFEPPFGLSDGCESFETEKEALEYACKEEERIGYLEYGIQYIGIKEQKQGLREMIDDCQRALENLEKHGSQRAPFTPCD